jgi:hypothetical protein
MEAMTEIPTLRRPVPRSRRVVAVGLALLIALSGGFALGRTTVADARDGIRPPTTLERRGTAALHPIDLPARHPRVKWGHGDPGRRPHG